jgi:hypothetical protein
MDTSISKSGGILIWNTRMDTSISKSGGILIWK